MFDMHPALFWNRSSAMCSWDEKPWKFNSCVPSKWMSSLTIQFIKMIKLRQHCFQQHKTKKKKKPNKKWNKTKQKTPMMSNPKRRIECHLLEQSYRQSLYDCTCQSLIIEKRYSIQFIFLFYQNTVYDISIANKDNRNMKSKKKKKN